MSIGAVKLPKQWKQWCKKANLRPISHKGRRKYKWMSLKGRGRLWAVNLNGKLVIYSVESGTNRWERKQGVEVDIPPNEAMFLQVVQSMVERTRNES